MQGEDEIWYRFRENVGGRPLPSGLLQGGMATQETKEAKRTPTKHGYESVVYLGTTLTEHQHAESIHVCFFQQVEQAPKVAGILSK